MLALARETANTCSSVLRGNVEGLREPSLSESSWCKPGRDGHALLVLFLYKPPLHPRLRGPGTWAALCPYRWARAAAPACLQVFAATESKILPTGFVHTKLLFKAFICSRQFYCSFNLSTLVLYRIFDGIKTFFLVLCLLFVFLYN